MTYEACPIKRPRWTGAAISDLRDAIIEIIDEDPPMTVRQVFYQLVTRGAIEKSEKEYQQTVIRLMTDMRLDGMLPFEHVVDESRRVRVTQTFDSVADAIAHTARFYRRSALREADDYLEIWLEKDALAGVLWDVTSDYDVPLMVIVLWSLSVAANQWQSSARLTRLWHNPSQWDFREKLWDRTARSG